MAVATAVSKLWELERDKREMLAVARELLRRDIAAHAHAELARAGEQIGTLVTPAPPADDDIDFRCGQWIVVRDMLPRIGDDLAILDEISHRRDRKSTRLNSSHVAISYAVFRLTKNKAYKI